MSDFIENLPISTNEIPSNNEYIILDSYFPTKKNINYFTEIKLSILLSFLFIIVIYTREFYFNKLPFNIFALLSFIIILVTTLLFLVFF